MAMLGRIPLIVIGPTGVGKSEFALDWASHQSCDIINADSRQFYRDWKVGTGVPSSQDQKKIPHHFLQFLSLDQKYSVSQYKVSIMDFISNHPQKKFVLVGGSGFYIKNLIYVQNIKLKETSPKVKMQIENWKQKYSVNEFWNQLFQFDPQRALLIHPNDQYRIEKALENFLSSGRPYHEFKNEYVLEKPFKDTKIIILHRPREELKNRIAVRIDKMLRGGWIEEVEQNLLKGGDISWPGYTSLGYLDVVQYIRGEVSLELAREKIQIQTYQYAKKQVAFFKSQFPNAEIRHISDRDSLHDE